MNIIQNKLNFLKSTLKYVPKQISKLYLFGFQTLTAMKITSLRANARYSNLNFNTAKSKIYRLTINNKMVEVFEKMIKELNIVKKKDIIIVDFSIFNNFQLLMFAKETKKGRAIPIYFEVEYYPIKEGHQNNFIINAIKNFNKKVKTKNKLVFDRGFACPDIIKYLSENKQLFVIRIKKSKKVIDKETKEKIAVQMSIKNDIEVNAYKKELRLIISDKSKKSNEPWYLITNDIKNKREEIIKEYYYRFEIEELFRDIKRLLLIEYLNLKNINSFKIVMWFIIIGMWFIWSIKDIKKEIKERTQANLSKIRYFIEKVEKINIQVLNYSINKLVPK